MSKRKTISYRGGIARFNIPASWTEEYEPTGGATFYEDEPDSGTLRLNVLNFSSNGKQTGEQMIAGLVAKSGYHLLHNGLAIKQYIKSAEENGEQLKLHDIELSLEGIDDPLRAGEACRECGVQVAAGDH